MSKHGTDERGWPLVPCDPAAIPEGYEAVRVGYPRAGEIAADGPDGDVIRFIENWNADAYLIVRPIKPPIELPLMIVPHGWWVYKSSQGQAYVSEEEPTKLGYGLVPRGGRSWCLPPWIAAQLPDEWHELPWDKSVMQQTEGGEG